ncbi:MAG: sporulation integral membrane protein YtvI [Clostridiaceae bacterium]|jgi:sporulation integral membrane protein YtvI|nr:sporulation integral membrane protein YtvI [Clostridiaceae bacterium]
MTEPVRRMIISIIRVALILLGVYLLIRLSLYCIPFVIAFILSSLIEPVVSFLERKVKIPRKIGSVFSIFLVLSVLGTILGLVITRLVREIINVYNQINEIFGSLQLFFEAVIERVNRFYISLPKTISDTIDQYFADAASNAKELLTPMVNGITNFTLSLPQALVFLIVTILATYFITSDKDKINSFLDTQLPNQWMDKTRTVMNKLFSALFGWMRAQFILMIVTFTELTVAFLVMRIENGLLFAALIAIVDALPVFGVGTFLIPWGTIELLSGNYQRGLSLLLLYIIILVIRQLIEPKIVGQQIGIHPLLTLFSMYLGLQLMGIVGMIVGPVLTVIIKGLIDAVIKADGFSTWVQRTLGFSPRPFRAKKENPVKKEEAVK